MVGFAPIGSTPIGSGPVYYQIERTYFDLDDSANHGHSIVVVASLFNSKLIDYFLQNPIAMKTMDRRKFEELVAELFSGFGYEVELTQKTRDGGKDIIAICNRHEIKSKYLIECKRPDQEITLALGLLENYGRKGG